MESVNIYEEPLKTIEVSSARKELKAAATTSIIDKPNIRIFFNDGPTDAELADLVVAKPKESEIVKENLGRSATERNFDHSERPSSVREGRGSGVKSYTVIEKGPDVVNSSWNKDFFSPERKPQGLENSGILGITK